MAIKKNVKVTDLPEDDMTNLLKITVKDPEAIEEQWDDVEETAKEIEHSEPVENLGESLEDWGQSTEVKELKALDEKFKKSPLG